MTSDNYEFSPQEKAADVTWRLARGESFRTSQVAEVYGITIQGAYRLMHTVSRVIPVSYSDSGIWRKFEID